MRKILIHAGISPLDRPNMGRVFRESMFTTNSGNLLFQYAAYRTLMTEDTQFISQLLERGDHADAFIERVNGECACVALPMANNFRGSYNLKPITRFIRRLKIPCVVMGVGLQAADPSLIGQGFPFDADVKDFIDAVLDRSALLGLRGEMTAEYLQHLGYAPERHFTVIGCPSMYSRGLELPRPKPLSLSAQTAVNFGYRIDQPRELASLLERGMCLFPDYHIVAQRREEIFMLRYGRPVVYTYDKANRCADLYPHDDSHPAIREGRMVGFANAKAWLDFMEGMDFNMGSRIHGNIAAVLSGTPTLALTLDTRMEELCRYHEIPHIPASQVDPGADPRSLLEGIDFDQVTRGHARRFEHFVDFLNANGLEHIYSHGLTPPDVPFDRALAALPPWGMVVPHFPVPLSIRAEGWLLEQRQKVRKGYQKLKKRLR